MFFNIHKYNMCKGIILGSIRYRALLKKIYQENIMYKRIHYCKLQVILWWKLKKTSMPSVLSCNYYSLNTGQAVFQYSPFLILRWFKSNEAPCAYCFTIPLSKPLHFLLLIKIFKIAVKLLVLWGSNNKNSHAVTNYIVNCYKNNMKINQYLLIFRYSLESYLTNECIP